MQYFTRRASKEIGTPKGSARWKKLWAEYELYLASIKEHLTPGWRQVADADFHDAAIVSVERPNDLELVLRINKCWNQSRTGKCTLHFHGVRKSKIPVGVVFDYWLYNEVHRAYDGLGDLQVLFGKREMRIVAQDVEYSENY